MKRLLAVILVLVLSLSVVACGSKTENEDNSKNVEEKNANETTPTEELTATPTAEPTAEPTATPTATPTADPTAEPTAEPTAVPTEEPVATPTEVPVDVADSSLSDIIQGRWVIDVDAIWDVSKELVFAQVDMSTLTAEEIEAAESVSKKAFIKSLNSAYEGTYMDFNGNTFALKASKNGTPIEAEFTFDGVNICFAGAMANGAPEIIYDSETDRILLDANNSTIPFISYMREEAVPTEVPENPEGSDEKSFKLSEEWSPITDEELEGKWIIDFDAFIALAKSLVEDQLGISMTDEEYYAFLENAGGTEALIGDVDSIYVLFRDGECFLGSPEDGEEKVPYVHNDQGVDVTEDGETISFMYDAQNKLLIIEEDGIMMPFKHE